MLQNESALLAGQFPMIWKLSMNNAAVSGLIGISLFLLIGGLQNKNLHHRILSD
jgi:hypothetical protein